VIRCRRRELAAAWSARRGACGLPIPLLRSDRLRATREGLLIDADTDHPDLLRCTPKEGSCRRALTAATSNQRRTVPHRSRHTTRTPNMGPTERLTNIRQTGNQRPRVERARRTVDLSPPTHTEPSRSDSEKPPTASDSPASPDIGPYRAHRPTLDRLQTLRPGHRQHPGPALT
jgi:hypothetical protein